MMLIITSFGYAAQKKVYVIVEQKEGLYAEYFNNKLIDTIKKYYGCKVTYDNIGDSIGKPGDVVIILNAIEFKNNISFGISFHRINKRYDLEYLYQTIVVFEVIDYDRQITRWSKKIHTIFNSIKWR